MYYIAFEEIKALICLFSDIINVFAPSEVFRNCDPDVLGSRYTFKFGILKEIFEGNEGFETGHMQHLTF